MTQFQLNSRLNNDCYTIAKWDNSLILLLDNKLYPWFIIVPKTSIQQIDQLDESEQINLLKQSSKISAFIRSEYITDKINVASIGNMVTQIHIHVIGRHKADVSWPDVVWGQSQKEPYLKKEILEIQKKVIHFIPKTTIIEII